MIFPLTQFEELYFTTTKIEYQKEINENEKKIRNNCKATGFFYSRLYNGKIYNFLVTNRHVADGCISPSITIHENRIDRFHLGNKIQINLDDYKIGWFFHKNINVDIAFIPIDNILNNLHKNGVDFYFKSISSKIIPNFEDEERRIDSIEDIIFIGYPRGLHDNKNLLPIVRKGITATSISINYEGIPCFLIDASMIQGSSGSPVFLIKRYGRDGKILKKTQLFFLGLISDMITFNTFNKLVEKDIDSQQGIEITNVMNLGKVFKSQELEDIILEYLEYGVVLPV